MEKSASSAHCGCSGNSTGGAFVKNAWWKIVIVVRLWDLCLTLIHLEYSAWDEKGFLKVKDSKLWRTLKKQGLYVFQDAHCRFAFIT
jgi:hypothetical protein